LDLKVGNGGIGSTWLLADVVSHCITIPVVPVVSGIPKVIVSQVGQTLLPVIVVGFSWGPVEPFNGCVQFLPYPFARIVGIMFCLK